MLLVGLLLFYIGHVLFRIYATDYTRKNLKEGDRCSVYIGETRHQAMVLSVNKEVDVWVRNKIFRISRDQVYAV